MTASTTTATAISSRKSTRPTSSAPSPEETVCAPFIATMPAPATRPCRWRGVRFCRAVTQATTNQGIAAPASADPASTSAVEPNAIGVSATAKAASATPTARPSPTRRSSQAAVSPPTTLPPPCTLVSTPKNAAGWPRPSSMTAKTTVSRRPSTPIPAARASTICRSTGSPPRCRNPAANSRRNDSRATAAGSDSATRTVVSTRAATAKVPAVSIATEPPPNPAYRPAPTSGLTSRSPWSTVDSAALAEPS